MSAQLLSAKSKPKWLWISVTHKVPSSRIIPSTTNCSDSNSTHLKLAGYWYQYHINNYFSFFFFFSFFPFFFFLIFYYYQFNHYKLIVQDLSAQLLSTKSKPKWLWISVTHKIPSSRIIHSTTNYSDSDSTHLKLSGLDKSFFFFFSKFYDQKIL